MTTAVEGGHWRERAVSEGLAAELFFPPAGGGGQGLARWGAVAGQAVRGTRPVREEAPLAITTRQRDGVRGGLDPRELHRLARAWPSTSQSVAQEQEA